MPKTEFVESSLQITLENTDEMKSMMKFYQHLHNFSEL